MTDRRDYCESCGYTESHDPNRPGPLGRQLVERLRLVQDCHAAICNEAAYYIEQSDHGYEDDSTRLLELHAEIEFLHKRRGELVIERDRYKAALGQYPEGRDVMLSGALAEVETLRTEVVALREQLRLANVDAANESAERNRLLDLLSDAGLELARAKVFVGSREKMHPTGLMLYQTLLDKISDVIEVKGDTCTRAERAEAERDEARDGMAHYMAHDYTETKRANNAEAERDVWKGKAEMRGREGCEARAERDALRTSLRALLEYVGDGARLMRPELGCDDADEASANIEYNECVREVIDRARAEWKGEA